MTALLIVCGICIALIAWGIIGDLRANPPQKRPLASSDPLRAARRVTTSGRHRTRP